MAADMLIFGKLQECGAVETASSEETAEMKPMGGQGFSVSTASECICPYLSCILVSGDYCYLPTLGNGQPALPQKVGCTEILG